MNVLNKSLPDGCLNKGDFLINEKNAIGEHDNNMTLNNGENFHPTNFSTNGTSDGCRKVLLSTNSIQVIRNDDNDGEANSADSVNVNPQESTMKEKNNRYVNGANANGGSSQTEDEDEGKVHIVYAYVVSDSKKTIISNSELISLQISTDKDKNYTVKMKIKKLPSLRNGHFLCLNKNGEILAIGGNDGKKKYGLVEKFSADKQTWKQINLMHFPRSNFCGICTEDDDLFILGGEGNHHILNSVEYYDKKINSWRSLPPLNYVRHSASAAIFKNMIFVLGGKDGIGDYGKVHKSMEMLNLKEKNIKWIMGKPLKQARLGLATVVFQEKLYAIGGSTGVKDLSSVEIYDFETGEWTEGPSLNFSRSNFVVFLWNNQLVAYGGVSKHRRELIKRAEILNEEGTRWLLMNEDASQ
ncbi:kelch motif containing protein, putative [Plasmodium knowlesi strain H]|uniref:Kelch motif containing protein, putative n=3 Tax=Plasmodium knowlesi TaxID=5850 RepID=A0A5K1V8T2_PLAKH|nr:kelch domain-containing protein, putative [Plasmodium knowlesi strain H]OTN68589.1 putative Kelch motif containing protein [Plasmodium knowlesi]CAA9986627.1 kelch domain-containing protein, putative [Plasmodium knowlesi strain H]SBO24094.1 kelch motif containing protein, putative [Plasmodium knowlesi strain H]SBO29337.1 kelch motif containing protein, putative [Plasmodium knowlesi strain H]VVS76101.1 kelch domain-containing protein, putative [Plasmodium knowlesi strain H]|eukprot:XP_002261167.1 kelch motif containing protein, putative [Plasmodium knowlesi strain H]